MLCRETLYETVFTMSHATRHHNMGVSPSYGYLTGTVLCAGMECIIIYTYTVIDDNYIYTDIL